MPVEAMPLFNTNDDLNANMRNADRICKFVLDVGNFGQNREIRAKNYRAKNCRAKNCGAKNCGAKGRGDYFWRKFISFWRRLSDMLRHFRLFPLDSFRFFSGVLRSGLHAAVRGE